MTSITIRNLIDALEQQKSIDDWPPKSRPRPLRSFDDLDPVPKKEQTKMLRSKPQDQLLVLGTRYRTGEYNSIRRFLSTDPSRLGNKGKLVLLLTYLQLSREKPANLEKYAVPLAQELASGEPSEFGVLYKWLQNFCRKHELPPAFYQKLDGQS